VFLGLGLEGSGKWVERQLECKPAVHNTPQMKRCLEFNATPRELRSFISCVATSFTRLEACARSVCAQRVDHHLQ
jgi:hypothetical protein